MDIFSYKDYRKHLHDWLLLEKKQNRLNASLLSEKIGVHPTFISQVLKGNKDLSTEQWLSVCEIMSQNDYLHFLLLQNRAGTKEARAFYQKKLNEILKKRLQLQERMKVHKQLTACSCSSQFSLCGETSHKLAPSRHSFPGEHRT